MSRLPNVLALAMILAGTPLANAAADLPKFDIEGNCKASLAYVVGIQTEGACVLDEHDWQKQLAAEWNKFSQADKSTCLREAKFGTPSYVELRTCLEMRQWAGRKQQRLSAGPRLTS